MRCRRARSAPSRWAATRTTSSAISRRTGATGSIRGGRARTGDLGYLDADGYLYITGRARDLIIRGGINIAPTEIDNLVLQMPGVAEAATVGVPDPIYGEEVVVYVVPKPGANLDEAAVLVHCEAALPLAKRPKQAIFRDALPKSERRQDGPPGAGRPMARNAAGARVRRDPMERSPDRRAGQAPPAPDLPLREAGGAVGRQGDRLALPDRHHPRRRAGGARGRRQQPPFAHGDGRVLDGAQRSGAAGTARTA